MPYLEQGYIAVDHQRMGPAYLYPEKQGETLRFKWTAYNMEGEWAGPDYHSRDYVLTWRSSSWGILMSASGSEYDEDEPEKIEKAIAEGRAYKAEDFRGEESHEKATE
jgi:hypothetical protein